MSKFMSKFMTRFISSAAALLLAAALGGCFGETGQYVHRSDTIALDNGNAADANIATHTIDPWPPGVGDRRIPANGDRMVGAVDRYRGQGSAAPGGAPQGPGAPAAPAPTPSSSSATPSATLPY
jgi:hypothetical protein